MNNRKNGTARAKSPRRRYTNPVWPGYFADPFILRWKDAYFAYGTCEGTKARTPDEASAFGILLSEDLVHWHEVGPALAVPSHALTNAFWAPEVAALESQFLLYYSPAPEGRDELHRIRVATAPDPRGPFVDTGIDRLVWTPDGPRCIGPSTTPQEI
jgi:beta-xylosidase